MQLLAIVIVCAVVLMVAYRLYGGLLVRLLKLDDSHETPAITMRDDVDYAPIEKKFLLSQHFSAIAAAGPIVGPILAGVMFGWVPALIWIVVGCIFIGGVHDFMSLVASIRHGARSIAEVVHKYMNRRCYLLFLAFIWVALVYIIVAFTDIVAASFVGSKALENGQTITGAGTASASLMYLALPVIMGLLLRYTKLSLNWATVIFLPLVGLAIWLGQILPFDLAGILDISDHAATKVWGAILLLYCLGAAVVPMWMLLQPRGHLGGYFLYVALGGSMIGILIGSFTNSYSIAYPAFTDWYGISKASPLAPLLFITIACGACSGFHCLIASGTTSKQLQKEKDAKLIGYGAMLMEGMVAIISLACVMILASDSPILTTGPSDRLDPNYVYAHGLSKFLGAMNLPAKLGISFGLLAFTTFVYDTLDVCTRLGRYIIQELTGWKSRAGAWFATLLTAGVPLIFVMMTIRDEQDKPIQPWVLFWPLFGASNQLLAALALIGITVWLWTTRRAWWVWIIAGLPAAWMYVVSIWALGLFIKGGFFPQGEFKLTANPVPWAALVLLSLAAMMFIEAIRIFIQPSAPASPSSEEAQPQPA
jgi:carbon starvation protein